MGGIPGTNGIVTSQVAFDDGSGPALYVAGGFSVAGGLQVPGLARWNGSSWSTVGNAGEVLAVATMTVFDDGTGAALYAAGSFHIAGGVELVAKWDGSTWSALGSGIESATGPLTSVTAFAEFDDGSGSALYAAGTRPMVGAFTPSTIARWDGASWSQLGSDANGPIKALAAFDDGSGPALYAGGAFWIAGGVTVNRVARWTGSGWSALGTGVNGGVECLTVFDDGTGPALYVGGSFTHASGNTAPGSGASRVAKWDGSGWSALGAGVGGSELADVYSAIVFDDGGGPALYVAGAFTTAGGLAVHHVARWDGGQWSDVAGGVDNPTAGLYVFVQSLSVFDDGTGPTLFAGGQFASAGGHAVRNLARCDGASWYRVGAGLDAGVKALAVFDDGSGPALYAGGRFLTAGDLDAHLIARWDGSSWAELESGISPTGAAHEVRSFAIFDEGSGPVLFAGGTFSFAGDVQAFSLARWDGASWSSVGGPAQPAGHVRSLTVFDDGAGPALYVGKQSSGSNQHVIEKWDGASWSTIGAIAASPGWIDAFAEFDDGSGPALYVAGSFTSLGGVPANRVAKWDGAAFSALGSGFDWNVSSLVVHDDGSGPALYAGGYFPTSQPGGIAVKKWDGTSWTIVPGLGSGFGVSGVTSLLVHDDGGGAALYAGGSFFLAGDSTASHVAKWDGMSWSALGASVGTANSDRVYALAAYDSGDGLALYVGGEFDTSSSGDSHLAKWANVPGCGTPGVSFCEPGVAGVSACPCGNPPAAIGLGCNNSSNTGGARLSATGIARLTYDTVVMTTEGEMPAATSIVLQGDDVVSTGLAFGQGVRCVAGSLKRMYVKVAFDGSITAPENSDPSLHERSAELGDVIVPGTRRYYAVYYRDPVVLGGCTGSGTFNVTQQLDVLWEP